MILFSLSAAIAAIPPVCDVTPASECFRQNISGVQRFICPISGANSSILFPDIVYTVSNATNRSFETRSNVTIVGFGGSLEGPLTVSGDNVTICNLEVANPVTVRGLSAQNLTVVNLKSRADVGVVVVGVAKLQNEIDITGLELTNITTIAGGVTEALVHARADDETTISCLPVSPKVVFQPFTNDTNVDAANSCDVIDLSSLLAIFGRPYEVSFFRRRDGD